VEEVDEDFNIKLTLIHNWFSMRWIYFTMNCELFGLAIEDYDVNDNDDVDDDYAITRSYYFTLANTAFPTNNKFYLVYYTFFPTTNLSKNSPIISTCP